MPSSADERARDAAQEAAARRARAGRAAERTPSENLARGVALTRFAGKLREAFATTRHP